MEGTRWAAPEADCLRGGLPQRRIAVGQRGRVRCVSSGRNAQPGSCVRRLGGHASRRQRRWGRQAVVGRVAGGLGLKGGFGPGWAKPTAGPASFPSTSRPGQPGCCWLRGRARAQIRAGETRAAKLRRASLGGRTQVGGSGGLKPGRARTRVGSSEFGRERTRAGSDRARIGSGRAQSFRSSQAGSSQVQFARGRIEPGRFKPGRFKPGQSKPGQFKRARFRPAPGGWARGGGVGAGVG